MTYVVTESCVKCKYTDCAAMCPVEPCFIEGPNMLVIDPKECIDCFSADTKIITDVGVVALGAVAGLDVTLLNGQGQFVRASIKEFGIKLLQRVKFKPVYAESGWQERLATDFGVTVDVTPTHEWVLSNGAPTNRLVVGDVVKAQRALVDISHENYRPGYRHGLIFGGGRMEGPRDPDSGIAKYSYTIYTSNEQDRILFPDCTQKPERKGNKDYIGEGYFSSVNDLMDVPALAERHYIAGFIDGWTAADGGNFTAFKTLRSPYASIIEWAAAVAPLVGYYPINSGETQTGACWVALGTKEIAWKVSSIESIEAQPTFCAVVPEDATFTLANGILTHNCGVCVDACPVDAIKSDRDPIEGLGVWLEINARLAEKWGHAKGINAKIDELPEAAEFALVKDKIHLIEE